MIESLRHCVIEPGTGVKERTKQFAIRVVRLFRSLPKTEEARVIGKQALRSARQLQRITVPFAGHVLRLSSLRRSVW